MSEWDSVLAGLQAEDGAAWDDVLEEMEDAIDGHGVADEDIAPRARMLMGDAMDVRSDDSYHTQDLIFSEPSSRDDSDEHNGPGPLVAHHVPPPPELVDVEASLARRPDEAAEVALIAATRGGHRRLAKAMRDCILDFENSLLPAPAADVPDLVDDAPEVPPPLPPPPLVVPPPLPDALVVPPPPPPQAEANRSEFRLAKVLARAANLVNARVEKTKLDAMSVGISEEVLQLTEHEYTESLAVKVKRLGTTKKVQECIEHCLMFRCAPTAV